MRGEGNGDYTQAGNLFRLMTAVQKEAPFANTASAMTRVPEEIARRWIAYCTKADPDYGKGVARQLGIDVSKIA
ncbi:catalase-related domain-containing protein [Nitrosococcus halophilus]|uniref:catalase-related domain-containing protein n=1 Tax=Nitrosococcus halophilus TaxID=133539 RepID=UPI0023B196E5|nr:catalase-related domain-containing protein [Nitrosococcus halophilus]